MKKTILLFIFISLYTTNFFSNPIVSNIDSSSVAKIIRNQNLGENYSIKSNFSSSEFNWKNIQKWYPVPNTVKDDRSTAVSSFKVIEEHKSWVDNFSGEDIQELPVGVKHSRENIQYAIGIVSAKVYKDYTELTVFARVRLPQTNEKGYPIELFFGANNVKLSREGGIIGDANLVLLGDMHIPFNAGKWLLTLKGGFDYRSGVTQNKTYVTIACDGVKELGIQGAVEFSRELVLPVESDGKVNESKKTVPYVMHTEKGTHTAQVPYRVKGDFNILATDWNNLLVKISLQPFVLAEKRNNKNYDGNFQFHLNEAVLDLSDLENDPAVKFPNHYAENGLLLPTQETWRGVYVNTLEVKLPKEFKTSESVSEGDRRVGFGAHHLIIDNYGISGTFYADNVFKLNEGRTNKSKSWAYSLDHIELSIASNKLVGAGFDGRILLPISKSKANQENDNIGLKYRGIISEEEYSLTVSNDSVVNFDLWKAKGQLLPNSSIELKVEEGEFKPKAVLNGRLAISANQVKSLDEEGAEVEDASGKEKLVEFKGVVFQNLVLQTESPVFSVDYMGYQDEVALAGFPVSIANIGVTANETNANLYFDLAVNLMGENNGFGAKTSLGIIGSFEEEDYRQKWKFKGVELDAILLKADLGGFSMEGGLTLMNKDPEYGDGFAAQLKVEFGSIAGVKIKAKGIFGKKDFRYWQFDAMADLPDGVGTGVINLDGFGGGASYRMRRTDFSSSFSPTGIGYTPDPTLGLGVKAMVMFNAVKKEVIKGGAGFEIIFNRRGGIDFLGFYGQASFMNVDIPGMDKVSGLISKVKEKAELAEKFLGEDGEKVDNSWVGRNLLDKAEGNFPKVPTDKMAISASVAITYDFRNSVLHGELDAYVNVVGGFVKGRGSGGRAGWAVLHFAPEDWYIYIGTPQDRLGLKIGVGPISVETGGYFMVGSVLPGSPPPPPIVAEILGVSADELDYMRDENSLKSGGGFAFGADISVDTGDLSFLIFYARFQAGAGFDIMLRNYGDARCSNTGDQVGINGWYANGQAYVYLQGELGIRIKLFFVKKKIPIIKAGAAVLLQAKAPNPVWLRGYIGGHFNLLGGLIKGRFRFKLTIGEECIFENAGPMGGLKIITDVSPTDNSNDIDVFTIPQATFSMRVGQPIVIPEDDGDKTYKIILEKLTIIHNEKEIPGRIEWGQNYDRANFISTDILPPNQEMTVRAEVSFKEKIDGVFRTIMVDGKPAKEIEERTFTTGGAPDNIPLHNILYSYPVIDQKYFLENEHKKGYIQLKRGQDYLFDNKQWKSSISYTVKGNEDVQNFSFVYNNSSNEVTYNLPNISQSSDYKISIVSKTVGSNNSKGTTGYKKVDIGGNSDDNSVTVKSNKASTVSKDGEIERLHYKFTTSKYKTFKQKVNSINTSTYNFGVIYSDVIHLSNRVKDHEPFDLTELVGSSYTNNKPLVAIEAVLDDSYFTKDINPPLYAKYPLGGKYLIKDREENELGSPPKYALPIISKYIYNLEYEVNKNMLRTTFPSRYNLGFVYKKDWVDLQSQIANDHVDGLITDDSVLSFLDENFLLMRYGMYKTKLSYKLPGNKLGTSAIYKFKNPNNFR